MKNDKKKMASVALASVLAVSMMPVGNVAGNLIGMNNGAVYAANQGTSGTGTNQDQGTSGTGTNQDQGTSGTGTNQDQGTSGTGTNQDQGTSGTGTSGTGTNQDQEATTESKKQEIKVTFSIDKHTNINKKTITIKEDKKNKGVKLSKFIDKADITFDKGYELKGYYDSDDNKLSTTDMIKSNRTVYVKSQSKTKDLKEVTVKDAELDGKYVDGKIEGYNGETLYVYYKEEEIGSGTVRDGKFSIRLDKSNYDNSDLRKFSYYVDKDAYNRVDLTKVDATGVDLYDSRNGKYRKVSGDLKGYKNTKMYVYYDGEEIGSSTTDRDGHFDFTLSTYIKDSAKVRDLTFYVKSDSTDSKKAFITRALAGEKVVEGKDAGSKADVTVKDSKGNTLGTATADSDGKFKVNLNRALVAQETITLTTKESGKKEVKVDYIVPGLAVNTSNGYIKGFADGSFKPYSNMTRAEAAVMIARLVNGSENFGNVSAVTKFYDANNNWYSKAINFAVSKGIINGYEDGTFRPNQNITRAEFAKMLSNYIKTTGNSSMNFNDVSNSHWAATAIQKAYAAGVVNGYEDGTFKPDQNITRAESVKMLNIVFNKTASSYSVTFYDVRPSDWFYNAVMKAAN